MNHFAEIMKVVLTYIGRAYLIISCLLGTYSILSIAITIKNHGLSIFLRAFVSSSKKMAEELDDSDNSDE